MAVTELGTPDMGLHPLHGMHEPTSGSPARRPRSIRRTTSMDITRDADSVDPVRIQGSGRDLVTAGDRTAREVGTAGLTVTVAMVARVIESIASDPPNSGVASLVGAPAMGGFRGAAGRAAPELRQSRDLLYTLLDDVPVCALISGHALGASGALGPVKRSGYVPMADRCAGFATGGILMNSFEAGDPVIATGPVAPDLDNDADVLAWHRMSALPLHGMRRRRRIDVYEIEVDGAGPVTVGVDAMFRDTYVRADGTETIVHEYTLAAVVDAGTGLILESSAIPRVLPWQECPGAVDSARRITDMTLSELHFRVRDELSGTSTCTHLNDLMRSAGDVSGLMERLKHLR
ncbi:hypothetical protein BH09ACT8_BH09ACT8_26610 [soil metagenome]